MPSREEFRHLLSRLQWGKGLSKKQLVEQPEREGVSPADPIVKAIPEGYLYHRPDDVMSSLPEPFWELEEHPLAPGLPDESMSPFGRARKPQVRERTREEDINDREA